MKATRRQGLPHLKHISAEDYSGFISYLEQHDGVLDNTVKAVMKLDGFNAKFGKDKTGQVFFEGARTGPVFQDSGFSDYAKLKNSKRQVVERAQHYDQMLRLFKSSDLIKVLPNNCKVDCEIMYVPMSKKYDYQHIVFVTMPYQADKLGSLMTIFPYRVLNSETGEVIDGSEILTKLYRKSNKTIRIIDPNLEFNTIHFGDRLDIYTPELIHSHLLYSTSIKGKYRIGYMIEGIVLHLPINAEGTETKAFKLITQTFKHLRNEKNIPKSITASVTIHKRKGK